MWEAVSGAVSKAPNLKMKDSRIVLLEVLVPGHHAVKQPVVQGEGGHGGQKPAVTCARSRRTHAGQAGPAGPTSPCSLLSQMARLPFPLV